MALSVACLCAGGHNSGNALDKWIRQEKPATPENERSETQGYLPAAASLYSSPRPQPGSHSSPLSVDGLKWSGNSSRIIFNGLLKAFGLQHSDEEPLNFLEISQGDSSVRRRAAKENSIPHIIHQVITFSAGQEPHPQCCGNLTALQSAPQGFGCAQPTLPSVLLLPLGRGPHTNSV